MMDTALQGIPDQDCVLKNHSARSKLASHQMLLKVKFRKEGSSVTETGPMTMVTDEPTTGSLVDGFRYIVEQ